MGRAVAAEQWSSCNIVKNKTTGKNYFNITKDFQYEIFRNFKP